MRQQNAQDISGCSGNGGRGITAVGFIEMVSAVIRDSGDHQRAVVVPQDHMLIEQDFDSEATQLCHPGSDPAVILMVTGHEVRPVA